jgi:hypothetical protein
MTTFAPTAAIVQPEASTGKYVCFYNGQNLGSSKHFDYFEFHYKRNDLANLCALEITEFVYLNPDSTVKCIKPIVKKIIAAAPEMPLPDINPAEAFSLLNVVRQATCAPSARAGINRRPTRGRPPKQPEVILPAHIKGNTLSDEEPQQRRHLTTALKQHIKKQYTKLTELQGFGLNEAIRILAEAYDVARNDVYAAVMY